MTIDYEHPYWATFWYPSTVAYTDATYSIRMKAPELGNREKRSRNQVVARTKSGNVVVADFGNNLNTELNLNFQNVPDLERSGLVVFLSNVNWGRAKLAYLDHFGVQRTVRIVSSVLDSEDTGLQRRDEEDTILWNFNLDILDITDNIFEQDGTVVPSALALHLLDYDHPHNPKVTVAIGIETKVVESLDTTTWRCVSWFVKITKGTKTKFCIVTAGHNTSGAWDDNQTSLIDIGGVSADVSLAVSVGSGLLKLVATSLATGYTIEARRLKL